MGSQSISTISETYINRTQGGRARHRAQKQKIFEWYENILSQHTFDILSQIQDLLRFRDPGGKNVIYLAKTIKISLFGREMHYNMVYIECYTESNLQLGK